MVTNGAIWWAVTVDCNDTSRVADFWATLLDTDAIEPGADRPGWLRLQPRGSAGPFINFQPVAERKAGKLRVHLDVLVDDLEAGVARVVGLGGADTGSREQLPRGQIAVVQDPEGNEFCVLAPPAS
jgi:predicted enzyme related to lactoylglutathione lyase